MTPLTLSGDWLAVECWFPSFALLDYRVTNQIDICNSEIKQRQSQPIRVPAWFPSCRCLISELHIYIKYRVKHAGSVMLPAHFDDVTDDYHDWWNQIWSKILQELPTCPTRNIIANYEKWRTLHEYNRNLKSITRCDKSIARILDNPKFLHYREQIASSIVKVGG